MRCNNLYNLTLWTTQRALSSDHLPIITTIIIQHEFSNIILMADKHNIPTGKMHSNCRLLSKDIVCKITQRNNIRRANTCDPALKLINEITSDIQNICKEHLDAHWTTGTTHTFYGRHGLSNSAPPTTHKNSTTFNNKITNTPKYIANCFTKQITNTIKHATHKTNR